MARGNTKMGLEWPGTAQGCEINEFRNLAESDPNMNGYQTGWESDPAQHLASEYAATFVITRLWGLAPQHFQASSRGAATTVWKKFPLWLKSKPDSTNFPYVYDSDVDFYYFQHGSEYLQRDIVASSVYYKIKWTPQLYTTYKAKNQTQVTSFNAGARGQRQHGKHNGGYATQGGLDPGTAMTDSEVDREFLWEKPTWNSSNPNAQAARFTYAQAQMDVHRWQSDYTKQRGEMKIIADNVRNSMVDVPPHVFATGADTMSTMILSALDRDGYTTAQSHWYVSGGLTDPTRDGVNNSVWSGLQANAAPPSDSPSDEHILPPTPAVTRLVVRAPLGYAAPPKHAATGKPELVQVYKSFNDKTFKLENKVDRFFFPMIPNTVSYSGLGSRWVEIPRKGDYPIVEWSDWSLMKIQFEFLVAHENDGLFADVAVQLDQLRRMSQRKNPVSVFGMDRLFELQVKRASRTGRALQFVIAEFTIQSQRRTVELGPKEITAAQCSMTLQEIPIEEMSLISMGVPPLEGSSVPPTPDVADPDDIDLLSMDPRTVRLLATAGLLPVI
jgi:hypothetical protein